MRRERTLFGDDRLPDRFWSKVNVNEETGCWEWAASLNSLGYGAFWLDSRAQGAHRVAYHELVGKIPDGMHLDHLCRVRHCCNPGHLDPVMPHENVLRGSRGALVSRYSNWVPDWSPSFEEP